MIFSEKNKTTLEDAIDTTDTEATTYVDDTTVNMTKKHDMTMQQTLDDNM